MQEKFTNYIKLQIKNTYYFIQGNFELDGISCQECARGTYNDKTGSSGDKSCSSCPDGSVADSPGSETCTECQPVSLIMFFCSDSHLKF